MKNCILTPALELQESHPAVLPAQETEQAVKGGAHHPPAGEAVPEAAQVRQKAENRLRRDFSHQDVFLAGGQQVDPGGVDGAVSQHVRQLDDVPGGPVEDGGEQVAQVVGTTMRSALFDYAAQRGRKEPSEEHPSRNSLFA